MQWIVLESHEVRSPKQGQRILVQCDVFRDALTILAIGSTREVRRRDILDGYD